MKTRFVSARRVLTVALGMGAALVMGVAFALWTQTGTGSGSAKAIQASPSTVTVDTAAATTGADLYPGFTGGDLYLQVNNPNPYPVRFTDVDAKTVTSSNEAACPASNITLADKSGLTIDLPANSGAVSKSVADVVTLAGSAPDGCQGVSFTVAVALTGTQQ